MAIDINAEEKYVFRVQFPKKLEKEVLGVLSNFNNGKIKEFDSISRDSQKEIVYFYYIAEQEHADRLVQQLGKIEGVSSSYGLESFMKPSL